MQSMAVRTVFSIGLAVMLLMVPFGMSQIGMDMQADGTMGHCPFILGSSMCMMSPLAHIAASQEYVTTIVQENDVLALLLMLLFFATVAAGLFGKSHAPPDVALSYLLAYLLVRRKDFIPRSHLQEAFSNGILNSKVY